MGLCLYIKKENSKWESQIFSAYEFCIVSFEEKGIKKKGKPQNRHQSLPPPPIRTQGKTPRLGQPNPHDPEPFREKIPNNL